MVLFLHSLKLSGGKRQDVRSGDVKNLPSYSCESETPPLTLTSSSLCSSLFSYSHIFFLSCEQKPLRWRMCLLGYYRERHRQKKWASHYSDQQLVALLILVSWCFWTPCLAGLVCSTIDSHSLSFIILSLSLQSAHHFSFRESFTSSSSSLSPVKPIWASVFSSPPLFSRHICVNPSCSPSHGPATRQTA
jgi:hypothetical protein